MITRELKSSILSYNHQHNTNIQPALYVISDTGGVADFCATKEDYPIPSSMLNSTVSGLISRSLWRDANLNAFHGCVINEHLRSWTTHNGLSMRYRLVSPILCLPRLIHCRRIQTYPRRI
ncbi:cysteine protease StiP domain-containing protein [Vibrio owensii]|uniref:cysteine protease StiP domain-containing protein n=1 Tax=Vibrio owensii TaxID=696485 RepID=UPI003BA89A9E